MVTLTSSLQSLNPIQQDFRRLVMRLRRRGILKDYIRVIEHTKSGLDHIHMIYRGSFLEQVFLSHLWQDIHQAPIVDIRSVKKDDRHIRGAARELAKYMSKEGYRRYAWSWGWVYKGFVATWKAGKRLFAQIRFYEPLKASYSAFLDLWHMHVRASPNEPGFLLLLEHNLFICATQRLRSIYPPH